MTAAIFSPAESAYMAACERAGVAGRAFDAAVAVWRRSPPDTMPAAWMAVVDAGATFTAASDVAAAAYVVAFADPKKKEGSR